MTGFRRWGRYLATGIVAGFKVLLYLLLLIVPGIIKSVKLSFIDCIVATKENLPDEACQISEQIVTGRWWFIAWFLLLIFLIKTMIELAFVGIFWSSVESPIPSIAIGVIIKLIETFFIVSKAVFYFELEGHPQTAG